MSDIRPSDMDNILNNENKNFESVNSLYAYLKNAYLNENASVLDLEDEMRHAYYDEMNEEVLGQGWEEFVTKIVKPSIENFVLNVIQSNYQEENEEFPDESDYDHVVKAMDTFELSWLDGGENPEGWIDIMYEYMGQYFDTISAQLRENDEYQIALKNGKLVDVLGHKLS